MTIDFSSLQKAAAELEEYVGLFNSDLARKNPKVKRAFRASVVQAFEFTYELAVKMINLQLAVTVLEPEDVSKVSFAEKMSHAEEAGIIINPAAYINYKKLRDKTSHTYNVDEAEKIVSVIDDFLDDIHSLLKELKKRNNAN